MAPDDTEFCTLASHFVVTFVRSKFPAQIPNHVPRHFGALGRFGPRECYFVSRNLLSGPGTLHCH